MGRVERRGSLSSQSDDDEDEEKCPLCCEDLDVTDRNFFPCPCGYQVRRGGGRQGGRVYASRTRLIGFDLPPSPPTPRSATLQICLYCWNHIKGQLNGLCPACRTPYSEDPHKISPVDRDEYVPCRQAGRWMEENWMDRTR